MKTVELSDNKKTLTRESVCVVYCTHSLTVTTF